MPNPGFSRQDFGKSKASKTGSWNGGKNHHDAHGGEASKTSSLPLKAGILKDNF
jgi:hypothetical protein